MVTPAAAAVSRVRVSGSAWVSRRRTRNIEIAVPSVDGYSTRSTANAPGSMPAPASLQASTPAPPVHRKSCAGRVNEVKAKNACPGRGRRRGRRAARLGRVTSVAGPSTPSRGRGVVGQDGLGVAGGGEQGASRVWRTTLEHGVALGDEGRPAGRGPGSSSGAVTRRPREASRWWAPDQAVVDDREAVDRPRRPRPRPPTSPPPGRAGARRPGSSRRRRGRAASARRRRASRRARRCGPRRVEDDLVVGGVGADHATAGGACSPPAPATVAGSDQVAGIGEGRPVG